jgi:hypothetical protein
MYHFYKGERRISLDFRPLFNDCLWRHRVAQRDHKDGTVSLNLAALFGYTEAKRRLERTWHRIQGN